MSVSFEGIGERHLLLDNRDMGEPWDRQEPQCEDRGRRVGALGISVLLALTGADISKPMMNVK